MNVGAFLSKLQTEGDSLIRLDPDVDMEKPENYVAPTRRARIGGSGYWPARTRYVGRPVADALAEQQLAQQQRVQPCAPDHRAVSEQRRAVARRAARRRRRRRRRRRPAPAVAASAW